ncbi:hypothetical protein AB0F72_01490 [Actinoplanes sp. NPDC023936]|uniref:helix-turn-helix transcriptional regulator n=1 Tax=Actinoplanes sp. NPDC023936 TaxID=3154910 RepID=UPI0033C403C3
MTSEVEQRIAAALRAELAARAEAGTHLPGAERSLMVVVDDGGPVIRMTTAEVAELAADAITGQGKLRMMGAAEIRARLGVSRQRAYQLVNGPSFPAPYAVLNAGCMWEASAVEEWIRVHRPKLGPPAA